MSAVMTATADIKQSLLLNASKLGTGGHQVYYIYLANSVPNFGR